jgi:hypothetical protein
MSKAPMPSTHLHLSALSRFLLLLLPNSIRMRCRLLVQALLQLPLPAGSCLLQCLEL